MNLAELAVKIGFKGGEKVISTLKGIQNASTKTKLSMGALVFAFAKMSQEARKLAMNLDVFETATGLSGDVLQKMSLRAAAAGVSLDNYGDTLQRVQQMTRDIALGRGDIAPFRLWEIGLNKDPIKVIDQISARLKQLHQSDPGRAAQMARDFGLSNQMLYALLQEQTEEIQQQWLLKRKDKEALVQLNREWYKLWWYVKQIGIRTQGFLSHVALPLVKALVSMVKFVGEITLGLIDWVSKTSWIQKTIMIISALIIATLAYMFPITAALVVIALIIEDIYGYFTGKDSITGKMVEWIKSGEILRSIFITIAEIIRGISKILFGAKFTKKVFDFLENKDSETGEQREPWAVKLKNKTKPWFLNRPSFSPSWNFAKPDMAQNRGNLTINQHNELTMQSTGDAMQDVQAGGRYAQACMLNRTQMQTSQLAHEH